MDHRLKIVAINDACVRELGYERDALIGRLAYCFVHHQYTDSLERAFVALHSGSRHAAAVDIRCITGDGRMIDATANLTIASNVSDSAGLAVANIEFPHASESRGQLLATEHRQLDQTERRGILGEMTSNIAHEINQPLAAIAIYAQTCLRLIDRTDEEPERLREMLNRLNSQVFRASDVVECLREIARQQPAKIEEIAVNSAITKTMDMLLANPRFRIIDFRLDLASDVSGVQCDLWQFQHVLNNLIYNAVESMERDEFRSGGTVSVTTRLTNRDETQILISDNGTGVNDEAKKTMFRPFSPDNGSSPKFGLPVSRTIIRNFGGDLGFFNNEKCGATFFVTLPSARGNQA